MALTNKMRSALIFSGLGLAAAAAVAALTPNFKPEQMGRVRTTPASVSAALIVLGFLRGNASRTWTNAVVEALGYYATYYSEAALSETAIAQLAQPEERRSFADDLLDPIVRAAQVKDLYRWDSLRHEAEGPT